MEWKEHEQETEAIKSQLGAINRDEQREGERWRRQAEAGVCECACVSTHFLTFLTFMLAVLLLQERMRGSVLSSGISALLA